MNNTNIPKLPFWLLQIIADENQRLPATGDLEEMYLETALRNGKFAATLWIWSQILRSIPLFIKQSFIWSLIMFANYFKIAFRHIKKHTGYSFINITGLTIGITCSVLMLLWVQDELRFDRFHGNANDIHRIILDPLGASPTHEAVSPPILAQKMKDEFPEVVNSARIAPSGKLLLRYKDKFFYENEGLLADASFFEMFSFPFIQGNAKTAFSELHSIVITRNLSEKYFGKEDPIGKLIKINNSREYQVTGIIENIPYNSHLQFKYVRSFKLFKEFGRNIEGWGDVSFYTYVQLQPNGSDKAVNKKLKALIEKEDPGHNNYYLQPLKQIHLYSNFNFDFAKTGNIIYVYIFSAAAIFILLIACINYMNLATARSGKRSTEVGIRKVVGAGKSEIIKQFFSESVVFSFISLFLAFGLIYVLLPIFNEITAKSTTINISENYSFFFILGGIALLVGFMSGSYPALFLSAFQPIKVIKNTQQKGTKGSTFRKFLVLVQFTLSIILLTGTLVVHNQLKHIRNKNLGYDREHLICLPLRGEFQQKFQTIKNELLKNPNINFVTASSALPTHIGSGTSGAEWEGKNPETRIQMQLSSVDTDYLETLKMQMKEGRFFSNEFSTDTSAVILNESAIQTMGMENPISKRFSLGGLDGHIIGIIKNFHYKSLHIKVEPLILFMAPNWLSHSIIRVNGSNIPETVDYLEKTWKEFNPNFPFEYSFLDERINNLYRAEQQVGTVFNYFTILTIFIACLGLFGLSSFTAEQRTKEIGIRKVLGASVPEIIALLSKEFLKWIIIACVIACPISYLIMNSWLSNFASRINIGLDIFLFSAILALIIALVTVSYQAIKAATTNPVNSLKYE